MGQAAEAMVAKNRTVAGHTSSVSLCDLGYCSVGVDEGWEGCGQGANGTQHAVNGTPTIDSAFPDMAAMVQVLLYLSSTTRTCTRTQLLQQPLARPWPRAQALATALGPDPALAFA